jgi:hypothetical protein
MRLVLIAAILAAPSTAFATDTWTDPFPGVRRLHRVTGSQDINALVVDLCAPGTSVRATGPNERERTVPSFGDAINAEAAINGDFFSYADYSTTGPAMHNGTRWGGDDSNFVAPLSFGPGEVLLPPNGQQGGPPDWAVEVVSGHPTILVDGMVRDNSGYEVCTARHPRTAAGLSADRETLIVAVVDGRATNRIGMTCAELAALMKALGADDAVNLDGGGSSTMWLAGQGVVNHPSDGSPRVVANHLAIRATGEGPAPFCVAPPAPPDPPDPQVDAAPGDPPDAGNPADGEDPPGGCATGGGELRGSGALLAIIVALRRRGRRAL